MKFHYNGTIYDDFVAPYYMAGDWNDYINKADYLSKCGRKVVLMEGHVWDKMCFNKTLVINARNPDGVPCGNTPVKSPVKAPVTTPVKTPVTAPVPVPAPVPVAAPTMTNCSTTVSGFTLIDASTNIDIKPLGNTDRMKQINIRANVAYCEPKIIDSVLLQLGNLTRCERHSPYAMWGDASSDDVPIEKALYYAGSLPKGKHVIKATPYSGRKCDGKMYESFSQEFSVI